MTHTQNQGNHTASQIKRLTTAGNSTNQMASVSPILPTDFNNLRSKSLNKNVRQREMVRITEENENLLKRLQEKQSCYNVIEWEIDRKKQIKMLKKICYYPPSMASQKPRRRGKKRAQQGLDPNYEVF